MTNAAAGQKRVQSAAAADGRAVWAEARARAMRSAAVQGPREARGGEVLRGGVSDGDGAVRGGCGDFGLGAAVAEAFRSGRGADCRVRAEGGGRVFCVHAFVLRQRSDVFAAMLSGEWKEGGGGEAVFEIGEVGEDVLQIALAAMYGVDLRADTAAGREGSGSWSVGFALRVWEFAHRFDIGALEAEALACARDAARGGGCFVALDFWECKEKACGRCKEGFKEREAATDAPYEVLKAARASGDADVAGDMLELIARRLDFLLRRPWFRELGFDELKSVLDAARASASTQTIAYWEWSEVQKGDGLSSAGEIVREKGSFVVVSENDVAMSAPGGCACARTFRGDVTRCETVVLYAIDEWVCEDENERSQHMEELLGYLDLDIALMLRMMQTSPWSACAKLGDDLEAVFSRLVDENASLRAQTQSAMERAAEDRKVAQERNCATVALQTTVSMLNRQIAVQNAEIQQLRLRQRQK